MHVDWERTFEALTVIVILAFVVERALAVLFENRLFIANLDCPGFESFPSGQAAIHRNMKLVTELRTSCPSPGQWFYPMTGLRRTVQSLIEQVRSDEVVAQ